MIRGAAPRRRNGGIHAGFACWAVWGLGVVAAHADLSQPGPFLAAWVDVTVTRPDNSTFTAALYYPASTGGQGGTYDPSGGPYPSVSFGHGFLQSVEQYQSTLQHLATHGYFVIASRSQGGLFPSHAAFAADLRHCLTWLEQADANPASWLYQQVDTQRFALSGHSMGGGCSLLAAAADTRVRVVVNMAAAETNPSAVSAMPGIAVPIRLISGSQDSVTPLSQHGQLMYNAAAAPKQLPIIQGGYHCGFVDQNFFGCDSGSMSRAVQLSITRRLITEFLNLYLRPDESAWRAVWGPERDDDTRIAWQLDAGAGLSPAEQTVVGLAGETVTAGLTVLQSGSRSTAYDLLTAGGAWPLQWTPPVTPVLAAGQICEATVAVSLPGDSRPAVSDYLLSARSQRDGGTRVHATLRVVSRGRPGDLDCNGVWDGRDIAGLVLALLDPSAYAAAYPDCDPLLADLNGDDTVDGQDVPLFIERLLSAS